MKFEISIEAPIEELKILFSRLKRLNPSMKEINSGQDEGRTLGRITVIEGNDSRLDRTLQDVSESINRVERESARHLMFDLRVRNLSYSEPPSGSHTFVEAFRPVPSLTVQPWTPSMDHEFEPGTMVLDPQHAFGTGKHPTTKLCLQIMEMIFNGKHEGQNVLDFGCGTGLLAISAALMGAGKCLGVEIDAQAAETAQRNVRLNGLENKIEIRQGSWNAVRETFDLIFANIVTAALLRAGPGIPRHLKGNGTAVVSGFGVTQLNDMRRLFESAGLREVQFHDLDGWGALVLEKCEKE